MTYRIRVELMNHFEELRQRRLILPYYVSLEFPEKQKKLISWWSEMIEAAIRFSHEVYLSPSQLQVIFTIHGLKPVPLPSVLAILSKSQNFEWRDRSAQDLINKQQFGIGTMIRSILKYIIPQKSISNKLTRYQGLANDTESKIISTSIIREQLEKVKEVIQNEMGIDHNISYDFISAKVSREVQLSPKSIEYLINELQNKSWIVIIEANKRKVLLYSDEISDYLNPKWIDMQKIKFTLKFTINNLSNLTEQKIKQQNALLQHAKVEAANDKNKAKQILSKVLNIKKTKEQIQQRSSLLEKQLSDLEINEANGKAVQILAGAQKLLKQTMCDPEKLEKIAEENAEIEMQQRQMKMGFDQLNDMNKDDELEDQVDVLMKELEQDVAKTKRNKEKINPSAKFVENDKNMGLDFI